ncbi:two-component sensor histidine kinase [Actinoplanes ianthinogenes]|uniref:sensor histidine kinase n=1 Tax=Actinoplanes ianthinogenes TaxID=122358 RepID=UPI00167105BE|nr:sensor histidine kinase [Actinoplanes ianthinogenes]GGR12939.1 two-component sensor histidine kinase [Actinoplanes ianthinogenes]
MNVTALLWFLQLMVGGLLLLAASRASLPGFALVCLFALVFVVGLLPFVRHSRRVARVWLIGVSLNWAAMLLLVADAVWLAFPLYFLQLHLLARRTAVFAVVTTALAAALGFAVHTGELTVATVVGPLLGGAVAVAVVWGYQALYRESERRRRLIEELTATRADLAEAQRAAGVLAERERLAREIHDTLAQGLTSIQLLLSAAERALPDRVAVAADYVGQARQSATDNLAEARRFVAELTPPALTEADLTVALDRLCVTTTERHRLTARFQHTGDPVPLDAETETALLRIAQSALANTVRHAGAATVDVTLSFLGDHVALDVVDDGRGFDAARATDGFGLAGMDARARELGGSFAIESTPDGGTALAVQLPVGALR